jgi:hypothetical protein
MNDLFKHAPSGATELRQKGSSFIRWFNDKGERYINKGWWTIADGDGWKTIATRPQPRKTVEDAVEWHKNEYGTTAWKGGKWRTIWFSVEDEFRWGNTVDCDTVCTREEFEACVTAKSEPEWTHVGMRGQKCVILAQIANKAWIKYDDGRECVKPIEDLEPLKPTMSQSESDAVYKFAQHLGGPYLDTACDYLDGHDITD